MRVINMYNKKKPIISMEFFPPRTEKFEQSFSLTVDKLSKNTDYVSVTFGAGGSTKDGSFQTVKQMLNDKKIHTVAYIAGYGLSPNEITSILDSYKNLGIKTIFVIRGDKPQFDGFVSDPNSFSYASEIIAFIKSRYDFTLGCAGYPEGHIESESIEKDIEHLKLKIESGAEYIISQYFYDNSYFFKYVQRCRNSGIEVPIIPGIMPVYTVKMTKMLSKICGSTITDELKRELNKVEIGDKQGILNVGIEFAFKQCKNLLEEGIPGLHFYTMNRSDSINKIINRLKDCSLL